MNALPISLVLSLFLTGKVMLVSGSPLDAGKLRRLSEFGSAVQSGAIQTGTLIEKVVCRANGEQSYALYLPTKYTPERKWPILYAFDPTARGQIPIERFKSAAEEYGWIIAGSNNSRNGPNKLALEAFEAMWQDTHSRFSLDQRRVYTTGFSGGARAAVGLAFQCQGCITGVIASGAGFHSSAAVSPNLPFIYFAAVGTDDFNYPELKELENRLVKAGITHRLAVFSGDHEWLPPELAMEAIQWMELQAMKGDRRDKDPTWIESLWQVRLSAARAFEDAGQRYEAYQRYQAIATDFSGLKDVAATCQKAATLKEAREVKKSINEEKEEISKQRSLENQIGGLLLQRRDLEKGLLAAGEFRATINGLINQAKEAEDSSQRRVARRVLRSLLVGAYEQGEGSLRAQDYASAVFHFEIATEIAQGNPRAFFDLACAYALEGQKGRALQALRKAIEKGFNDLESITTNRALDSLRGEKVYIEMVKSLKKGP